ncbi:MAG: hypothetical protein NTU98_01925 [Bacteroidetes bacterium]|nr:hypothetical protein [Bacteroidota bacterium]
MAAKEESVTLYLAEWQKRMLLDFYRKPALKSSSTGGGGGGIKDIPPRRISRIKFYKHEVRCPASYKIPVDGIRKGDLVLYLTDEQMAIVQDNLGLKTKVTGINITDELIKKGNIQFL